MSRIFCERDRFFSGFFTQCCYSERSIACQSLLGQGSQASGPEWKSVQSLNPAQLFVTLWIAARQASLSVTNSNSPVGFLCLCVYFRFVNKFICTSFLFSTHKHYHVTLVFLSGGLHVVSTSSLPGQTTFRISFPGLDSFKGPCVLLLMSSIRNLD